MVLWIGVDDTDSLRGMCTTFLATELVRDLMEDYDLIGFPRLVRLNPNIPWKTRGNAAVCIRVGEGGGMPVLVGRIATRDLLAFPRSIAGPAPQAVEDRVASVVERWSCFDDPMTNPGFVLLGRPPSPRLYWKAVRGIVAKEEAARAIAGLGRARGYKAGRGIIGASAATSWRPRDRTYEVLTHRERSRWGTRREIDPNSVIEMDRDFPSTFSNYDYENGRIAIAPHSPCPVLFGIRGDDPAVLRAAMERIRGERPERWLVFETNQGTDDHVRPARCNTPGATIRVAGAVSSRPRTLPGGHVVFRVRDQEVTAYEPSKHLRRVARQLIPGDRVMVIGALRETPRTLNLEKMRIDALAPLVFKVANPICGTCGKRAKSYGRDAGFRCPRCGSRFPRFAATYLVQGRGVQPGWYEPPVGSRRHLSKPLRRMRIGGRQSRVWAERCASALASFTESSLGVN